MPRRSVVSSAWRCGDGGSMAGLIGEVDVSPIKMTAALRQLPRLGGGAAKKAKKAQKAAPTQRWRTLDSKSSIRELITNDPVDDSASSSRRDARAVLARASARVAIARTSHSFIVWSLQFDTKCRASSRESSDVTPSGSFHTSECRGGVERRQMELKGVAVGY